MGCGASSASKQGVVPAEHAAEEQERPVPTSIRIHESNEPVNQAGSRPVSASFAEAQNRFSVARGIVLDSFSSLRWQQESTEPMTWDEAKQYADSCILGGFQWRLPYREELYTIVDHHKKKASLEDFMLAAKVDGKQNGPFIDLQVFPGTEGSYWGTKNDYGGLDYLNFDRGAGQSAPASSQKRFRVRLVSDGKRRSKSNQNTGLAIPGAVPEVSEASSAPGKPTRPTRPGQEPDLITPVPQSRSEDKPAEGKPAEGQEDEDAGVDGEDTASDSGSEPGARFTTETHQHLKLVRDRKTDLLWQHDTKTAGPMSWEQANQYAKFLNLGGYKWRLPTKAELLTLIDEDKKRRSVENFVLLARKSSSTDDVMVNLDVFADTKGSYWAQRNEFGGLDYVDFTKGTGMSLASSTKRKLRVRCVSSGGVRRTNTNLSLKATEEDSHSSKVTRNKRIIVMGPPAAGKGTQDVYGCVHISKGDLLAHNFKRFFPTAGDSPRSSAARNVQLPDSTIVSMIKTQIETAKGDGWVLDGLPGNKAQAEMLSIDVDLIIVLEVSDPKILEERAQGRLIDPVTNKIYHKTFIPPPKGVDTEPAATDQMIADSLTQYNQSIDSILGCYPEDKVVRVPAEGGVMDVFQAIESHL